MNSTEQFCLSIAVDTPNVLFRGSKISMGNLLKLVGFIKENRNIKFHVALTPLLLDLVPGVESVFLGLRKRFRNVEVFYTRFFEDPDEVILLKAQVLGAFILSNDKFRQAKYDAFNKSRVIRYFFKKNGLFLLT